MNVVHVSPVAFGDNGTFGGGERYPRELARAMAKKTPTTLLTFGAESTEFMDGELTVRVLRSRVRYRSELNPISTRYVAQLADANIVHTHHVETLTTDVALLTRRSSRRVYTTDHGGRAPRLPGHQVVSRRADGLLAVSKFSAQFFPALRRKTSIVYGGVDTSRFCPDGSTRTRKVVFVGRLLPHKGVDVLLRALPEGTELEVYGRRYSAEYRKVLDSLSRGMSVTFHEDADDDAIRDAYRTARVVVLPSVYRSAYGPGSPRAELLGLTLLEAMACGTPVIATDVGGMPEVVVAGVTGVIVPPSDPASLSSALSHLLEDDAGWRAMSVAAAAHVQANFTWSAVAERCLAAYATGR